MNTPADEMPRTALPMAARVVIALVLLVGGVGLAWVLSGDRAGPAVSPTSSGAIEDPAKAEEIAALRAESADREATFDAAVKGEAVPAPEQVKLLEEALRLHREFLRLQPSPVWADRERRACAGGADRHGARARHAGRLGET